MTLSKKDYEMVAGVIQKLREESLEEDSPMHLPTLLRVTAEFMGAFKEDNNRFNPQMFMVACMADKERDIV